MDQLFQHSEAGRIHNQDAELQVKDPEALLTLPEFMREPLPQSERNRDGEALLSLPEFVREPIPAHISTKMLRKVEDSAKHDSKPKKRSRSLSAPPLAWLRSSASKTSPSLVKSNSQGYLFTKNPLIVADLHCRFRCRLRCRKPRESTSHSFIFQHHWWGSGGGRSS